MNGTVKNGNGFNAKYIAVFDRDPCDSEVTKKQKKNESLGTRHFVTFMLFLGMANAYIMRTNMSVAIVAMVNHTAVELLNHSSHEPSMPIQNECGGPPTNDAWILLAWIHRKAAKAVTEKKTNNCEVREVLSTSIFSMKRFHQTLDPENDGQFVWETDVQGYVLSSFFYGYVITQIPFGILSKRYGNIYFLGIGMLINSLFGLLVPLSANMGLWWLIGVRFIQGLGEGPIVPCTHALLAKWIPPNERSRMGAFVYAGAQFGTVISMPLSGLLSVSAGGWPSIFYVFGAIGTVWCIFFLIYVYEDPSSNPKIKEEEKDYINDSLGSRADVAPLPIPWASILKSMPFWAILLAHMGHNYGYETLMTELPTYMKQILKFKIKDNGFLSALPYLAMWLFSIFISHVADWMLMKPYFSHTSVRKIINGIGQYGPACALVAAAFTGCNKWLTVAILTIGVGLNGGIYSGFKVNHLDISPHFAGILMALTNCLANLAGLLAPIFAGNIVKGTITHGKWAIVFLTAAGVYAGCCTFYIIFGSGKKQPWDDGSPQERIKRQEPKEKEVTIQVTST